MLHVLSKMDLHTPYIYLLRFDFNDLHQKSGIDRVLGMEERDSLVTKLHTILDPFMLRRMKSDVEDLEIPPKREFLVTIDLTEQQKTLYSAALKRDLKQALPSSSSSSSSKTTCKFTFCHQPAIIIILRFAHFPNY